MRFVFTLILASLWILVKGHLAHAEPRVDDLQPRKDQILRGQMSFDVYPLNSLVVPQTGVSIGTYIRNNHLVEFKYAKGSVGLEKVMAYNKVPQKLNLQGEDDLSGEINGVYEDIKRTDVTHSHSLIQHRYFWTGFFYTKVGIGYKNYGIEYPINEVSQYDDVKALIEVSRETLAFGVGHRWMFKNVLLNMEWIDVVYPINRLRNKSDVSTGSEFARNYNKFTNQIVVQAFNLSFGLIF